ncbi:MAG: Sfum_1244 family protein, partial [Desulfatiglandales bacterium]
MRDVDDFLEDLVAQIRFNCELATLRQAGGFSICGLAMRLKDLYKWEHGLAPWEEDEPRKVLDWVGHKEQYWETIEDLSFQEIRIGGKSLEPMDMESVNSILVPMGLYYGAGLSEGIAPSFFLGILENTNEILSIKVNVISKELARDLVVSPAMSRQKIIIVRKEPLLQYLWNEILFAKAENRRAFYECFRSYGLQEWNFDAIKHLLSRIAEEYIPALVHH